MELLIFMIVVAGIAWLVLRSKPGSSIPGNGSAQQGREEMPAGYAEVEVESSGKEFLIRRHR